MDPLVRDALEVLLVVAVGGILWSAIGRMRRGEVTVMRCPAAAALTCMPSTFEHPLMVTGP